MSKKPQPRLAKLKSWGLLFGIAAMIGLLPIISNFNANRFEVALQATIIPILAALIVAAIIASVFYRFYRRDPLGGFVSTLLTASILGVNYDSRLGNISPLLSAIMPLPQLDGLQGSFLSLVFMLIIGLLSWLTGRLVSGFVRARKWPVHDLVGGASIAITVAFALLFFPMARTLWQGRSQYFYKPSALNAQATVGSGKPDIYYIVMEDYANQTQLQKQFGFDNSQFLNYLASNGYYVDPNAHQNYPYTTMSIASTLNAGYNTDMINRFKNDSIQNIYPYHRAVQYSSVVQQLKTLGYQYNEIGSWYETTNRGPLADNFYLKDRRLTLFNHTFYIDGYTQSQLAQSPFWRFLENGVSVGKFTLLRYQGIDQIQLTKDSLYQLKTLAGQSSGGRFIFAHIIAPHQPYNFNADGSISATPNDDDSGRLIKDKYVGQLQYINSQIQQVLDSIKHNSGGHSVVILQSDEGPHPQELNEHIFDPGSADDELNNQNMNQLSDSDLALKYGTLAAYQIPGASAQDLKIGATNLNVFRLVLNQYFGAKMSYLPECYYAFPSGRNKPFVYEDITPRITGIANSACAPDGTGPK